MFKEYRKKTTQPMRPYIFGEDLTGINVDKGTVPEVGGMIAVDPNNPSDQWYIAPGYFAQYYEPAQSVLEPYQQRVLDEKIELDTKLVKLGGFLESPTFATMHIDEQERLRRQFAHMNEYSKVLGERIATFTKI